MLYAFMSIEYEDVRLEMYIGEQRAIFAVKRPMSEIRTFIYNHEIDTAYHIPKFSTRGDLLRALGYAGGDLQATYVIEFDSYDYLREEGWMDSDWKKGENLDWFLNSPLVDGLIHIIRMPPLLAFRLPAEAFLIYHDQRG